ncbi:hypothetical protein [Variovorax sp. J31P207]|uniref:hypothetical protein n=1 Tax=Variovorax sp. J31P207 TaxID=3053510 RepID=UPI002576ECDC|nr:hypothetical protein [Variovorax sp. J31P207]MDM0071463.1 hypothetical protein [Variovorax sp. J31P207]
MHWLIVVTFLGGSAWGPAVTMTATPSAEACRELSHAVAASIVQAAKTNMIGITPDLVDDHGAKLVVRGEREVARIACSSEPGRLR